MQRTITTTPASRSALSDVELQIRENSRLGFVFTVLQRLRSGSSAEHAEADETVGLRAFVCVGTVMITTFLVAMRTSALLAVSMIGRDASV